MAASWDTLPGLQDPKDSAFHGDFFGYMKEMLPAGVSNDRVVSAIQSRPWYGNLGSGSNPYAAAYEVMNALGSTQPYDQAKSDSLLPGLRARSPEGIAEANDDDDWFSSLLPIAGLALGGYGLLSGLGGLGTGAGFLGDVWGAEGLGGLFGGAGSGTALTGSSLGLTGAGIGGATFVGNGSPMSNFDLPAVDDWSNWGPSTTSGGSPSFSSPSWVDDLLKSSGEFGVDATSLEGGFNSALSKAPWWSGLPTEVQNMLQKVGKIPGLAQTIWGSTNGSSNGSNGSYQFPFGKVIGGVLDSYGASQQRNDLKAYLDKALTYADPFHDQRPGYQTQFRQLTSDPSNFFKDPAIRSAIDFEGDATSRKLASQGYNMSGNFATGVSDSRMREAFKNYLPYSDMIGTAAGYKFGPGQAGSIAATTGGQIAGLNQQVMGGLGAATQSAVDGSQPSYLDQIFGAQRNHNLAQLFMQGIA